MSDIFLRSGEIVDCKVIYDTITIKVDLLVEQYDYIIRTSNNRVVKGNKYKKVIVKYKLEFSKARNIGNIMICKSCGAKIRKH